LRLQRQELQQEQQEKEVEEEMKSLVVGESVEEEEKEDAYRWGLENERNVIMGGEQFTEGIGRVWDAKKSSAWKETREGLDDRRQAEV
jgi:hypothetical protein